MADLELLIHTSDTFLYDHTKEMRDKKILDLDRASNVKQGYLQAVKPVGSPWGKLELDPKRFMRAIIPEHQFNPQWLEQDIKNGQDLTDKIWRFNLATLLSQGEYEALTNITYNDSTIKPSVVKAFADISSHVGLVDWNKQPIPIKLHGSAGDFSIQEDGGGNYTSLKTAVETEAGDISGGGDDANFYITEAWTGADTGNWDIDGWTMGGNEMLIQTQGASRSPDGTYLATGHRIENATQIFDIENSNTTVDGIQCKNTGAGIISSGAIGTITLDSCIIASQAGNGEAFQFDHSGGGTDTIINCVVYKTKEVGGTSAGLRATGSVTGTVNIINSTLSGYNDGIERDGGTMTATNCAVFNNDDDFDGTITIDYCASDDGDGTNAVDISPGGVEATDWAAAVTDYANGDFSVKDSSSPLYNTGTATGAPADDIMGTARPQSTTDDIGAFELVVAAPSGLPVGTLSLLGVGI